MKMYDRDNDICIIGMSGEFPDSPDIDIFWENLAAGKECISSEPERNHDNYIASYGVINNVDEFDNDYFGITRFDAEKMDCQQRKLIEHIASALENAGYSDRAKDKDSTGLFCSTHHLKNVWEDLYLNGAYDNENESMLGFYAGSAVATRIAYMLNLTGPVLTYDAACASSLVGIHMAVNSLKNHECGKCVVAAASIASDQKGYYTAEGAMSSDGHTCPYDKNGTGFVPGSAAAAVVLKRYADAVRDGDNILAVIKGSAMNNDGNRKIGFAAPSVQGEYESIVRAIEQSGINKDDIFYIEGHGTATPLGDAVEITALNKAFEGRKEKSLALGSVKSNIGHTDCVSGLASVIKVVCSFREGFIPATINCRELNDEINANSPLFVSCEKLAWDKDKPMIAGVNSFGVGGTDTHIVIKAPDEPSGVPNETNEDYIACISGKSKNSTADTARKIREYCRCGKVSLTDAAVNYRKYRRENKFRTILTKDMISSDSYTPFVYEAFGRKKIVYLFPGGGSQYKNMGREMYKKNSVFRDTIEQCLSILKNELDIDLTDYFRTEKTYEVNDLLISEGLALIFAVNYAFAVLLRELGAKPDYVFGSSLGEYAAACVSGVLPLEEALKMVVLRGRLIQGTEDGLMLSVPADRETVEKLLEGSPAEIASINCVNRILVSGRSQDVEEARTAFEKAGIPTNLMNAGKAGHSCLVDGILDDFESGISDIRYGAMKVPVISSFKGREVSAEEMSSASFWREHMRRPIEFYNASMTFKDMDNIIFVEAGTELTSFIAKNLASVKNKRIVSLETDENVSEYDQFIRGVGELWTAGVKVNFDKLYNDADMTFRKAFMPGYVYDRNKFERHNAVNNSRKTKTGVYSGLKDGSAEKTEYILSLSESKKIIEPVSSKLLSADALRYTPEEMTSARYTDIFRNSSIVLTEKIPGYTEASNEFIASCILGYFMENEGFNADNTYTIDKLVAMFGVKKEWIPFIDYFISFLSDNGYCISDHGLIVFTDAFRQLPESSVLLEKNRERFPDCCAYMEFCMMISRHYKAVFTGKETANSILYPDGKFDLIASYDARMPVCTYQNECIESLSEMVRDLSAKLGRKVRILEIGGGTGELTDALLGKLNGLDIEYTFTDIGQSFVSERKLSDSEKGITFMKYGKLDVSLPVSQQGFEENYFDIIVMLNVIQATADIRKSLKNVSDALAEDGVFMMVETCGGSELINMIFGFAPGWWNYYYDDTRKRITVSPQEWRSIISDSGFRDVVSIPEDGSSDTYTMIMRAPAKELAAGRLFSSDEKQKNFDRLQKEYPDIDVCFADLDGSDGEAASFGLDEIVYCGKISGTEKIEESGDAVMDALLGLISDILGVSDIDGDERLSDAGFDSLSGLILSSKIKERFGAEISIEELFRCETPNDLKKIIDERAGQASSAKLEHHDSPEKNIDDFLNDFDL